MSAPPTPHYKANAWRPDRLRIACHARGLDPTNAGHLEVAVNGHRAKAGRPPASRRACRRWLGLDATAQDPTVGRTGHEIALFDLAAVLDVSLDWLTGRVDHEPSLTPREIVNAQATERRHGVRP